MAGILHELTIAAPAEKEGLSGWWTPGVTAQLKVGTIAESLFPGIVLKLKVERLEAGRNVTRSVVEAVTDWKDTVINWDLTSVPKAPSFCSANTTTARSAVSMSGSTSRGPGMSCPH